MIYFVQCWNPKFLTRSFDNVMKNHIESINKKNDFGSIANQKLTLRIITKIDKESFETIETIDFEDIVNDMLSNGFLSKEIIELYNFPELYYPPDI